MRSSINEKSGPTWAALVLDTGANLTGVSWGHSRIGPADLPGKSRLRLRYQPFQPASPSWPSNVLFAIVNRIDLVARLARLKQLYLGRAKDRWLMQRAMRTHGCPMLRAAWLEYDAGLTATIRGVESARAVLAKALDSICNEMTVNEKSPAGIVAHRAAPSSVRRGTTRGESGPSFFGLQ